MDVHLLPDCTPVEIRQIRPDDRGRLRASHARLSPETRYRRFLSSKPTLTESDARYLAEIDGRDHFALVAVTPIDDQAGQIIAVARFVRLADEPDAAEFAIVVGDDYQRLGLATGLLQRLAAAAVERGITHFRGTALAENVAIQRLLARIVDGEVRVRAHDQVIEMEADLSGAERRAPHLQAAA